MGDSSSRFCIFGRKSCNVKKIFGTLKFGGSSQLLLFCSSVVTLLRIAVCLLTCDVTISSSSSEQELQFSDDDDGTEEMPDVSWQDFIRRAYTQRFAAQQTTTNTTTAAGNDNKQSSDTDTVGGASDADWETESDTDHEAHGQL